MRTGRLALAATLAVLAAACAPLPRPTPAPVPPTPTTSTTPTTEPGPAPQLPERPSEPSIAVGLAWDLDAVTLDPVGAARITGRGTALLDAGATLAVSLEHDHAIATSVGNRVPWRATLAPGDTLWLEGSDGPAESPARLVRWQGKSWRGRFKIFLNPRGKLTLATVVPLETYLAGVIPGEIGALKINFKFVPGVKSVAANSVSTIFPSETNPGPLVELIALSAEIFCPPVGSVTFTSASNSEERKTTEANTSAT